MEEKKKYRKERHIYGMKEGIYKYKEKGRRTEEKRF